MELLNDVLHLIVEGAILLFEFMGVAVLISPPVCGASGTICAGIP